MRDPIQRGTAEVFRAMATSARSNCWLRRDSASSKRFKSPPKTERVLGREKDIGTLAAGKCADPVLVRGDPSSRIADIENVEIVFNDGVGYDSRKLIESVRGQVGIR